MIYVCRNCLFFLFLYSLFLLSLLFIVYLSGKRGEREIFFINFSLSLISYTYISNFSWFGMCYNYTPKFMLLFVNKKKKKNNYGDPQTTTTNEKYYFIFPGYNIYLYLFSYAKLFSLNDEISFS